MASPDSREPAGAGRQRGLFAGGGGGGAAHAEPPSTLDGVLGRITFRNADTGFTVARIAVTGGGEATAVGELDGQPEGTPLLLKGTWVEDRKFGRQFKFSDYEERTTETLEGIEKFLASDVPGIGPELARRMVSHFGMATIQVAEEAPDRLVEVPGIGAARADRIATAIANQGRIKRVKVFLRGHGVAPALARRIVDRYGRDAIRVVREDPYRLARDVRGIGFRTADALAKRLGLAPDAPSRLEAGLLHVLAELGDDGHTHAPEDAALDRATELLGVERDKLAAAVDRLETSGEVTRELLGDRGRCVSLTAITLMEIDAATTFAELLRTPARTTALDVARAVADFEVASGMALAPQQRQAVIAAAVDKCVVITGGPGVGKTTIVRAVVHLAARMRRQVGLAAPTGRAAKRLAEATGAEAMTLHRLLEYQPQTDTFARYRLRPLEADLVIVDETSMVDLALFRALVVALRPGAQLVLVGDIDQLPSVGAGAVLGDVIASGAATVVRLTEIFRQAAQSRIVTNAHRINHGELPEIDSTGAASDFYFIAREDPTAARDTVIELVAERIPARFGFDRITDIQVLAPMHRGDLGIEALNHALQARLNPPRAEAGAAAAEVVRRERVFRVGDKVMQLENDYDREVLNGDIGVIDGVDVERGSLRVALGDGRIAAYERGDLEQLTHAYAVSIHKSQGSEYPAVIIALANQHFVMLGRSLLYTAVTRGKKLVIVVGSRRALAMAVRNETSRQRWTWLAERIRAAAEGEPAGVDLADADDSI
ncbi:MAG TPA: ATP-dependent RecD-like DNA helicase [Kofleriaceae bacterium]|nr:ATP-dependent RecD-like DNA helicase [Kofleriaceae bacterium]